MNTYIYPSSIETARALILYIIDQMSQFPIKTFHIAFSGGGTPSLMYDLWANEYKTVTDWERIEVYFVDERCVASDHSESNYGLMRSLLLNMVPIPCSHVHPINGGAKSAEEEAERYSLLVREKLPNLNGFPAFDLVLLGVGEDGHTSSIFPGQENLLFSNSLYECSFNPTTKQKRIALTGIPILSALKVVFLVTGQSKASIVSKLFRQDNNTPASFIVHRATDVDLFLDDESAIEIYT